MKHYLFLVLCASPFGVAVGVLTNALLRLRKLEKDVAAIMKFLNGSEE